MEAAPTPALPTNSFEFSPERVLTAAPTARFEFSPDHDVEPAPAGSFEFSPDDALGPTPTPVSIEEDAAPAPERSRRREFLMIALAVVVGGAFTFALLMARAVPSSEVSAAAPANVPPVKRATSAAAARVPGWTAANSAVWAGRGRNSAAFELQSDTTITIWMRTVRPMLVVRCASGSIEAFVFTASAAKIEPQTDAHTVRFSFDGSADVTERWPDSEQHDALFAPDGASFARGLAAATVMRFGFTPHNAAPVTAQFHVAGLAALIEPVARECGWHK